MLPMQPTCVARDIQEYDGFNIRVPVETIEVSLRFSTNGIAYSFDFENLAELRIGNIHGARVIF